MQWGIDLEKPFDYSLVIFIVALVILGLVLYIAYLYWKKNFLKKKQTKVKEVTINTVDKNEIKEEYLNKIDILLEKVRNKKVTTRRAYNELSIIIREYVFRLTGVNLLKYSLIDFEQLNNKILLELIKEYYEPEFSYHGMGDIESSILKTRKVIEEWK